MEMIPELVSEGRRILLFSQFTSMLALIEEGIARLKIPYVLLTGDTVDRTGPVRNFQAGKVPLFLPQSEGRRYWPKSDCGRYRDPL